MEHPPDDLITTTTIDYTTLKEIQKDNEPLQLELEYVSKASREADLACSEEDV